MPCERNSNLGAMRQRIAMDGGCFVAVRGQGSDSSPPPHPVRESGAHRRNRMN